MSLGLDLGFGVNRGGGVQPDFALEFNGTDEYLQIALPSELITNGTFETNVLNYSSGNTTSFAQDTEAGKQGNYCAKWIFGVGGSLTPDINSALVVGQKYKVKLYYKSTTDITFQSSATNVYTLKATSEWNYVSFIFTALTGSGNLRFYSATVAGTAFFDNISVKHDQGFDLNKDQEQILHSRNALFNNAGTDWVAKDGSSNQQCTLSTVDKSEGTGSLLITATGAGDATDHHVKLPAEFLESCVSGKKYTKEIFARLDPASLVYGADKVITGDFSNAANFTITNATDFNVTGGVAVKSGNPSGTVYQGTAKGVTYAANQIYKVILTVTGLTGNVSIDVNGGTAVSLTTAATHTIYLIAGSNAALGLRIIGSTNTLFTVDNISSFEATPITLTAVLGTKTVTSSALSIVSGTFTKVVLNFLATASEQSQDLKLYLSGAGSVFVDKLSLTQAYDVAILSKKRNLSHLNSDWLLATGHGSIDYNGYDITIQSSGAVKLELRSSPTLAESTVLTGNTSLTWFDIIGVINRTDTNGSYNRSNVLGQITTKTLSAHGKVILSKALVIGTWSTGGTESFNGLISHIQIWRFENISQSTFNSALTGLQYPTGGGAEEVLRLTFQSGYNITECLKDYSPKAHTVSGIFVDITNRKRVTA